MLSKRSPKDVYDLNHPNARAGGNVLEHRWIASKVLGKPLSSRAVVHHVDGNKRNNENDNLIICEDSDYHRVLHVRERALRACGNPNWRKCSICKEYDASSNLYYSKSGNNYRHVRCHNKYKLKLKRRNIE